MRTNETLHLTQTKYISDLLYKVKMSETKHITTPATTKQLSLYDGDLFPDPTLYRSTVGVLQYLSFTRADIAFSVNKVCQFMHKPTEVHWQAVKRILRYLAGTRNHGICFNINSNSKVIVYADADHASCPDDRSCTSGYCVYFGTNLISWSSTKQKVVS